MSSLKSHIAEMMTSTLSDTEVALMRRKESIASFFRSWQFAAVVVVIAVVMVVCGQYRQREKNEASAATQGHVLIEEVEHNAAR